MWRLDRLGKQLEAVCAVLQVEMAELLGNENRVNEILKERRQEHAERKKANRQFWITWGFIGAGARLVVVHRQPVLIEQAGRLGEDHWLGHCYRWQEILATQQANVASQNVLSANALDDSCAADPGPFRLDALGGTHAARKLAFIRSTRRGGRTGAAEW
jgi:hypothetical protein